MLMLMLIACVYKNVQHKTELLHGSIERRNLRVPHIRSRINGRRCLQKKLMYMRKYKRKLSV